MEASLPALTSYLGTEDGEALPRRHGMLSSSLRFGPATVMSLVSTAPSLHWNAKTEYRHSKPTAHWNAKTGMASCLGPIM